MFYHITYPTFELVETSYRVNESQHYNAVNIESKEQASLLLQKNRIYYLNDLLNRSSSYYGNS